MVDSESAFLFVLLFILLMESTLEQQLSSPTERSALFELRSSLGLRSKEWPIEADSCLNWTGVQCENGRVIGLNISGFRRTRIGKQNPQFAVDALPNLTLLVSFNSSKFALPGSIPDWFGQRLVGLQVLDLRSCYVTGAIPLSIGNLSSLSSLYLSDNRLTGTIPSSFGQLVFLSVLDISQNSLTGSVPPMFSSLGNLSVLDISSNNLSGSIPLNILTLVKLRYLNLSHNNLSSSIPSQLGELDTLIDLDLSFNSFSGSVPPDLGRLSGLQKMVIGNNLLGGSLPENLFANLTRLQSLFLEHNCFSGALPDVLWSMPDLLSLDVSSNNFTGILPNTSLGVNDTPIVLNISNNLFYGGLSSMLIRFSFIDISGNYFEGKVPENIQINASFSSNCLQTLSNQRSSAQCSSFYAERGLTFDNFGIPPLAGYSRHSSKKWIILAGVLGGFGLITVIVLLLLFCARKRGSTNQNRGEVGPVPAGESTPPPGVSIKFSSLGYGFTYQQLLEATGGFNDTNLIKHGHSGDLFRGILENGMPIVIKRINLQSMENEKQLLEFEFFSKVSHTRTVPFLGYCLENENEKFLVYKYMPNGDLASSLSRKTNSEDDSLQSLDWITRLKIATGAAEALSYLHHEHTPPLVHRDVEAGSILLDDDFEVRLGSLSEVCVQEGDAHQNCITRWLRLSQLLEQDIPGSPATTCVYDIYCFGKVLLELVTGKLGISATNEAQMKEWLEQTLPYISVYDMELVTKIVDPSLIVDEDLLEEVWAIAIVARSCLNPKPSKRPLMRYILKALENPLKVVREESYGSAGLRTTTSSRGSWNVTLFGSWHSSSDVAAIPASLTSRIGGPRSIKQSRTTGLQGSAQIGYYDHSSSRGRHSSEIFPEPSGLQDVQRL